MDERRIEGILVRLAEDRGDEGAWTALYAQFRPFVFAVAYRRTNGSRELARDAAQEVFLRLVKYCPFDRLTAAGEFRAYLAVVTRNVIVLLRQRQRLFDWQAAVPERSELELSEPVLTPHGETIELRQLLRRALGELPSAEKEVLALWLEGYSHQEIARRIGTSPGNVAVRLHRIRAKLRRDSHLRDLI